MRPPVADIVAFLRRHWMHLTLLLPMALVVTAVHELAHAVAVALVGGTVLDWGVLPTNGAWGHVGYRMPVELRGSMRIVAAAPYLLWLTVAAAASAWAWRRPPPTFRVASAVFVWGIAVPLADVAYAAVPYLLGADNDLLDAFGPVDGAVKLAFLIAGVAIAAAVYAAHRRLYGGDALSRLAFALAVAFAGALMVGLTVAFL